MSRRFFERRAPKIINFGWSHGRYLDYWSIVHFLTGVILGAIASIATFPAVLAISIIAVLATLYEGLEILSKVAEDVENVISDIIAVTLGGALAIWLFDLFAASAQTKSLTLGLAMAVNIVLIHLGWRHYLLKKSQQKGSSRYLKLVLYILTLVAIKIIISSLYFWSASVAH